MIASCIEKMRRDACGGCARKDICSTLFKRRAGPANGTGTRAPRRNFGQRGASNPFLAFLGEVAKALGDSHVATARPRGPRPGSFAAEIEVQIEPLLALHDIRIERVARNLGLSRQTLYRRLKAEGVTFEEIVDGLRRRLALGWLREGVAIKEIAYRLGFSDPSAFSRAFKRWTGSSPRGSAAKRPATRQPPRPWSSAN